MEIITFGVGGRQRECDRILNGTLSGEGRLIVLPIPTSRDNRYITDTDKTVEDIEKMLDGNTLLAGYNLPRELSRHGGVNYDASLDEDFLLENAILTANGCLGYILTHSEKDISRLKIGVVGYGRIGKELMRLMLIMGSSPRLYTTRESVAVEMGKMGVNAEIIHNGSDIFGLDILINTAPARLIDTSRVGEETLIIDLASGRAIDPDERLVRRSSVPDAMYPKTAGELYAGHIISYFKKEGVL
jgi:hypothetical protein